MADSNLEREYETKLKEALDFYFPKGKTESRGHALMLFAIAISAVRKTVRAFGGCESCYGKGYSTSIAQIGRRLSYCACNRGVQLERIMNGSDV